MESRVLASITERLEERDARSKYDWVTLATAMLISAGLAGGGAVYFTKQQLDSANFQDAIQLIQSDDDAYWCGRANGQVVNANDGSNHCAIHMPNYVEPEIPAEGSE